MTSSTGKIKLAVLLLIFSVAFTDNLLGTGRSRYRGGWPTERDSYSLSEQRKDLDETDSKLDEDLVKLTKLYEDTAARVLERYTEKIKLDDAAEELAGDNNTRQREAKQEKSKNVKKEYEDVVKQRDVFQGRIVGIKDKCENIKDRRKRLKGPDGFFGRMSAAAYLGFVGYENFEVLVKNEIWDPSSPASNVISALALKGSDSLGKSVDRIVQESLGDALERGSMSLFTKCENFLSKYWRKLIKLVFKVDGEPFDHQQVQNFGEIVCGLLNDYITFCKDARRFEDRDKKSRLQEIEFGETLSKIKAFISEKTTTPVDDMRSSSSISELGIDDSKWEELVRDLEVSFDLEIPEENLSEVKTIKDVVDLLLVDPDWKYESDRVKHNVNKILDYIDLRIIYYKGDKDSMEYRYGSMVREGLAEFVLILSQAKSDKDLGTGVFQRRLKRLNSSMERSFKNLLKYIPGKRRENGDSLDDNKGTRGRSRGRSRFGGGFLDEGDDDDY